MSAWDIAIARVLRAEGGYVNDARDAGGETRFGISHAAHPTLDIARLTIEQATAIYKRDFWDGPRIGTLPDRVAVAVFDAAVNSGVKTAIKWLQQALAVTDDGVIGEKTLSAARAVDPATVVMRFEGARLKALSSLKTWPAFGRGWARRIADNLMEA